MNYQTFLASKTLTFILTVCLGGVLLGFTTHSTTNLKTALKHFSGSNFLTEHKTPPNMNFNYDQAWREIDSLEQQGLPKSALEKTEIVLEAARGENASGQFIKALIYRGKYQSALEEYGLPTAIYRFQEEMQKADFPVKPILQSMLAEMYTNYLNQNHWKFRGRTQTLEFKPDDIKTWSAAQLSYQASKLFRESLADHRLKNTPIEDFKILLTPGKNDEGLRPTLFDFLAHRAIDHFMNEQTYLTQPAYKFYIDDEKAFASAGEFTNWKISTKDTTSQKYQTLLLFQDLLRFKKLEKKEPSASLLDADLKRLKFVYDNAVLDTKDAVYQAALEHLQKEYEGTTSSAEVAYRLASFYFQNGAHYQAPPFGMEDKDERKWYWKKALSICDEAREKHPGSFGAMQCNILKADILEKSLNLSVEMVNLPVKPFLAKIEYRNLPEVWLKIVRFDEKRRTELEKIQYDRNATEKTLEFLNSLTPLKSWSVQLPSDGDYRNHSIEIKMDGLELGQYLIMAAGNSAFSQEQGAVGYVFTNISKLGYWQRQGGSEGTSFVVFDRENGTPLKGIAAEFFVQKYNSITRKYQWQKKEIRLSNANGLVLPALSDKDDRNFRLLLRLGNDTLLTGENFYNYTFRADKQQYQQTRFFLDRAIYRPGQTVYFKGIAMNFNEQRMPSILKNKPVTVTFLDANWQEISKLELRTNEYGTFSGQFTAPRSGLLGTMQLQSSIGGQSQTFRVEEYKRPKFEVTFEPVKGSYHLNETVAVEGKAMAYAGSNIDAAQVTWRVVREVQFPWLPWWYRGWFPWQGETMEIANGVSTTDAEGKFEIKFTALPDRSIPKDQKPQFSYTIYADVTDITGETQSNEMIVSVGYLSMKADVLIGRQVNLDSLKKFELLTQNLNGQFEPAQGTLSLELLHAPRQIYAERYWSQPDRQVMTEAEFKKSFPQFAWMNENEPESWPVKHKVLDEKFDTRQSKEVLVGKVKLNPGWYALTLTTKDKSGEKIEVKKFFNGYDLDEKTLSTPITGWHVLEKPSLEPGSTAPLYFGTTEKNLPLWLEVEKDGKILERKWLNVKGLQVENFKIAEEHRGNVHYHYSWAKNNRSTLASATIVVPWSNKDLTIEYGTFRDKLLPGQQEEWVLKIKGPKGEKVAAEMVAGMYDASLDAFAPNSWNLNVWPMSWTSIRYSGGGYQQVVPTWFGNQVRPFAGDSGSRQYSNLNWFNWHMYDNGGIMPFAYSPSPGKMDSDNAGIILQEMAAAPPVKMRKMNALGVAAGSGVVDQRADIPDTVNKAKKPEIDLSAVKVRTILNETVFFYPNLMTDSEGNVILKFTMNEALTRWKFLGLATTPDLKTAATMREVVTQKDLMVLPNPPRFFRENDEIEFTAKVSNLTDNVLSGEAKLELTNALTGEKLNWASITNKPQVIHFSAEGKQSARLAWRFKVPSIAEVPVIEHTVIASAGKFSDAERSAAPVLSNRMLVTETLPLPLRGKQTKTFVLNSLKNSQSNTLRHEGMTLEFTQNPAWYAVQALPYLMEYPYECSEQIFARYYANSLATSVANSHPRIKSVFESWKQYEPAALQSNLRKNQELKTALLEETPWVLAAQSEEMQKQNIALLFDLNRMAYEQEAALKKLQDRQLPGGGWAWFSGGPDNWYITQYIVEGLGHLQKLGVQDVQKNPATWQMVQNAISYCDARISEQYERLEEAVNAGKAKWEDDHLDYMATHYLYARSFFLEDKSAQAGRGAAIFDKGKNYIPLKGKAEQAHAYYSSQAEKYWLNKGMYTEGMLALVLNRTGKAASAQKITRSLQERSLNSEELGMYWKYPVGWWWYQAPIETHALMIEVFSDVANDAKAVNDLKVWLLKNKQTNHWKTTKATSAAVYALLSSGDNWLLDSEPLGITIGNPLSEKAAERKEAIAKAQHSAEAGTGFFKLRFDGKEVSQDMASISVSNPNNVVAWGALYWQYFEQLDKINTFEETPLTIKKQLFRVVNTATGEALRPIAEAEKLKVGEKLKVRIELRVDRNMEYVHMKDMRAAGFEPINVLSQYKWQGGLGYYESTTDASTNFFFSWLPKGTYVFEYPLRVTYNGDFSNGITTIQSMYAPEFTSHSEGIRVKVEE